MTSLEGWRSTIELRPLRLVVGEGFEPSKAVPLDLQSSPFGRSGNPPRILQGGHAGQPLSEPAARIELATFRLQGGSSTVELRWQGKPIFYQ